MDENIIDLVKKHKDKMESVFKYISIVKDDEFSTKILHIAKDYYNDSLYFMDKQDYIRAFEALIISWSFINAGILNGSFKLPVDMLDYFII